jgi:DNA-binding transcriptional regulator YiaG
VSASRLQWTPQRIQALRYALNENTDTFGARFARSGRAVENWEQGRNRPDALVVRELDRLEEAVKSGRAK